MLLGGSLEIIWYKRLGWGGNLPFTHRAVPSVGAAPPVRHTNSPQCSENAPLVLRGKTLL